MTDPYDNSGQGFCLRVPGKGSGSAQRCLRNTADARVDQDGSMPLAPTVMILGCTSDAGKSFLVTAICRSLANHGVRVAPFKAQNMSNNAAVTADGLEIGRAQFAQAIAAKVTPDVRMNPILLKPSSERFSHVIANGKPAPEIAELPWLERPTRTWPIVESALESLRGEFEVIVIEGAGSPAEVNLRASDIVNMRVALASDAICYLVADIDRGGAFAHLLGTWQCLEPNERALIQGFVLNKFRGDPALLGNATEWLEEQTGVPTVAVIPMVRHALPEEDRHIVRNTGTGGWLRIAIIVYPYASNLDEFDPLGWEDGVNVELVRHGQSLEGFHAVILPGSRNTAASLRWLREVGLDNQLQRASQAGTVVLGVCGGLQMLGLELEDPDGIEGQSAIGLGYLPVRTSLRLNKTVRQTTTTLLSIQASVKGYEIHHGHTTILDESASELLADQLGWSKNSVHGIYVHGLFEESDFRQWFLDHLGWKGQCVNWADSFDAELDQVAEEIERTGLVAHIQNQIHDQRRGR